MTTRADLEETRSLSVEEFTALPEEDGYRLELSRGRLVREPAPGPLHGQVAGGLLAAEERIERTVTVYRSRSEIRILEAGDILEGEEVLPELRLPVAELFAV